MKKSIKIILLVGIIGVIISIGVITAIKFITPATNPPVPPSSETQQSSTGLPEWKTYRNEEYGFEFKYPENYHLGECIRKIGYKFDQMPAKTLLQKTICFSGINEFPDAMPTILDLQIRIYSNAQKNTLQEWIKKNIDETYIKNIKKEPFKTEHISGFVWDSGELVFVFSSPDSEYIFFVITYPSNFQEDFQIISTFSFI